MILLHTEATVLPENQTELNQAVRSILEKEQAEGNLLRYGFFGDMNRENGFLIMEEWKTLEALEDHLRSDSFCVMLGALKLLSETADMRCHAVSHSAGEEALRAARTIGMKALKQESVFESGIEKFFG